MKFLVGLLIWIFSALPLIFIASFVEFKQNYNLYNTVYDYLAGQHPIARYVIISIAFIAIVQIVFLFILVGKAL